MGKTRTFNFPTREEVVLKRTKSHQRNVEAAKHRDFPKRRKFEVKKASTLIRNCGNVKRRLRQVEWTKNRKVFCLNEQPRLAVVVRIAPDVSLKEERELLQSLRLEESNTAVFVQVTEDLMKQLLLLAPYIVWGYPSLPLVRDMIFKKATTLVNGKRKIITNNVMVEETLGQYGVLCLDDLIHELVENGPAFLQVNAYLQPFRLHPPPGGWKKILPLVHKNTSALAMKAEYLDTVLQRMI